MKEKYVIFKILLALYPNIDKMRRLTGEKQNWLGQ